MVRISRYQLLCLIIAFEIGSTTLFALGIDAKQDAWIAIVIAIVCGFALLWVYTQLHKYFSERNLAEIIIALLGKVIGGPLVFLYALFFIYCASRNLRDFGELIVMTSLPTTPQVAVLILFMIAVAYILFLGIQTLGRTSEILTPVLTIFIVLVCLMVTISGHVNLKELIPVLSRGFKPVLKATFPLLVMFPFGEMVVFLMFLCNVYPKKFIRKSSFLALGISGLMLVISNVFIISTLGVDYASNATIPFVEVVDLINIGDIITNLDVIGITIMMIGGLYKVAIFLYGGVLSFTTLFKIQDKRWIMLIISAFVIWLSIIIAPSYPSHIWIGQKITAYFIFTSFEIAIPILLLIIFWVKR